MKKLSLFFLFCLTALSFSFAQTTVTGKIYDGDSNAPLLGANIMDVSS